eukprot:Phypoly_transcript_03481.p1 GENE.Phypoly_transcript_03481~~Phypoly_transcript_03481.p1  ORF type:complete len:486 (+),score=64.09 Phypoly_transcript_03481:846-2303(+)
MLALLGFILLIFLYIIYLTNKKQNSTQLPGPLCLPFIGSAWALGSNPSIIHATLTDLAKKYGPIFRLMIGNTPMVVLSDPELIREAFNGTNPPVLLRFTGKLSQRINTKGHSIFTTKDRDFWALLRRMCSPMTRTILHPIPQLIEEEKEKLFAELDKHLNQDVHLNPLFMIFTRNVFLRIFVGTSWSFDSMTPDQKQFATSLFEGLKKGMAILELIPLVSLVRKFSGKGLNEAVHHAQFVNNFIRKIVEERRKENMKSSVEAAQDLLDILLLEQKEHPEVSDDSLIDTLRSIFVAASATSADTLDWLILFLCTYPDIQEKCYKEITEKIQGRTVTLEDQSRLPYLDNVIKETFRLRPAAPIALPRVAERDFTIGKYHVEKGSIVVENLYGVGNLEAHYDNPTVFDPDRWDRHPEKSSNLIQFGVGPTICLGMNVAKQEIFLTAASLLQKYKFSKSPTSPEPDFIGEFKVIYNPKLWYTSISSRNN